MGNIASTTRLETSHTDFTTADMMLDQLEKQACLGSVHTTSSWVHTTAHYCAIVLSTMTVLLMGNLTWSLDQPNKTPILVDAACQTEDEDFTELSVNCNWQPCHVDGKDEVDDDCHSCTTEATELFTDAEGDNYEHGFSDDEFEGADVNSEADAICDAYESCVDGDCETQAEQLLQLTSIVCAEGGNSTHLYLEDYLCTCGECPHYKLIAHDVALSMKASQTQKQSTTRLLQAFSTYNEVLGYSADMIPAAHECLRIWCGDEDKAFKSFVTLYDEVPQLCGSARCT